MSEFQILRETRGEKQAPPFSFYNMLPFTVHLYRKRNLKFTLISIIEGGKTVRPPGETTLVEGDLVYIFFPDFSKGKSSEPLYSGSQGNPPTRDFAHAQSPSYYNITHPHTLRYDKPIVRLGDIIYNSMSPTFYTYSANDISGLWFHNNLPMEVEIWMSGLMDSTGRAQKNKLGIVGKYDGATSYLGGSGAKLYLDNDAFGFRLGDQLEFRLAPKSRLYGTLTLNDNFATDIHLGVINALPLGYPAQTVLPIAPDNFTYRVDGTHEIQGTTFFTNAAQAATGDRVAYETVRTSPHAFF